MPEYNPNTTATKGLEAQGVGTASQQISTQTGAAGMAILSLAGETINQLRVWMSKCDVAGEYVVEVYPITSLPESPVWAEVNYNPNEDVTVTNVTGVSQNGGGLRYQNIDEGVSVYDPVDYLKPTSAGALFVYEGRVGSAGFSGRPLFVTLRVAFQTTSTDYGSTIKMGLNVGGVFYDQTSATTHNVTTLPQNWTGVMEATFYTNPSTHAPWTVAEIQSFDSTNEFQVRMEGAGIWDIGKPMDGEHVIAVDMIVGQATENRVAIGTANLSTFSTPQWINFTTTNMSGGNWSKTNAVRYLYVVRRATTYGNATVQGVQLGSGGSPVANFDGYSVGMNAEGMVVTLTAKSPDVWWGLIIRTSAPADSADSQVYTSIVEELVHSTSTPTTEFSNAAAANYGNVRLLVKYQGSPTADLTVRVRRRSDNTVMGSVITITKAQVDALPSISGSGWKYVEVQQGSLATLATATQYYWEFSSTTGSANAWKVPNWYTGGQGDALSFGGTTDRATRSGSENNSYDIQATIGTVPSTPGSWAVSLQTQTVPSDASEGTLASIQYANCTWAATSLAALFAYYEIHRTEDGGTNWSPIANLTSEAQTSFKDYEGDRGTLCGYRIRVVRTDGAFSAWSSTQSVTPAKLASDVWAFVCNENQGAFNCIYKKLGGGTYTFPEADEVGFHPVFDEDFYTVTRPTEQRGAQTEISVVMSSLRSYNQGSNTLGWALYDRLRSLARAQVDYVCVHDPWGNRMLAVITVPEGPIGGEMPWVAVIRIKQTTITYSLPTA